MVKFLIYISFLTFSLISCTRNRGNNVYDPDKYKRITSDKDSMQQMQVVYVSKDDKNRNLIRTYYNDGTLMGISYYYDKKRDGHWLQYVDSKLSFAGSFSNGKKVGVHKYYFPNGKLFIVEEYKDDTMISKTEYTEKGEILYTDKRRLKQ